MPKLKLCYTFEELFNATPGLGYVIDTIWLLRSYIRSHLATNYIEAMEYLNRQSNAVVD